MNVCDRCGATGESFCPVCGYALGRPAESPFSWIKTYFTILKKTLLHPAQFFREARQAPSGVVKPLVFALVTHWLAKSVRFLWQSKLNGFGLNPLESFLLQFEDQISGGMRPDPFTEWISGISPVLLDPFVTLFSILYQALLIFVAARIFVSPNENRVVNYESALRIACFSMGPALLAFFPVLGDLIAPLYTFIICLIGVRETYRIRQGIAILIVLFPKLLILGIIALGLTFFVGVFFKIFSLFF